MTYKSFTDMQTSDMEFFGLKAIHLATLLQNGFPVPMGLALSSQWTSKIANQNYKIPDEDLQLLEDIYKHFSGTKLAVRSSGLLEDMRDASFAGQYDTVLDIDSFDAMKDAIIRCIKSSFTASASSYAKHRLNSQTCSIAIILQKMVPGQISGVMFGANPITNNYDEIMITGGLRYGFGIVDGSSPYDEYILNKETRSILRKQLNISRQEVQAVLEDHEILSIRNLEKLAAYGSKAEKLFGQPQDMEWVIHEDQVFILQSRSITTLYPIEPQHLAKDKLHLYICYNTVVQGMTKPYTPLGYEFSRCTFAGYTSIFYSGKKKIMYPSFIPYINGRIYYDLTEVLGRRFIGKSILSSFDDKDPQGGKLLRDLYTLHRRTFLKQGGTFKLSLGIVKWGLSLTKYGKISKKDYRQALKEAIKVGQDYLQEVDKRIRHAQSIEDKLALIETVMEEMLTKSFQQVMYVAYGLKAFGKWQKWFDKHYPNLDLSPLSKALPNNPTTQMGLALMTIAEQRLDKENPPLISDDDVQDFLSIFGHRSDADTDLGAKRWSEQGDTILNLIKHYLKDNQASISLKKHKTQEEEAQVLLKSLVNLVEKDHSAKKAKKLDYDLNNYRTLIGLRELPKFNMVKILAKFRHMLLQEAKTYVETGHFKEADDISYLLFKEILELKHQSPKEIHDLVIKRRAQFKKQSSYTKVPRIILSNGETYFQELGAIKKTESSNQLQGIPLSSGSVRGRVKILTWPDIKHIDSSEILVTHNTDPSWTPIFPGIKGLIMESGGPISHGAIVAREYGLPSIGGVPLATEILKNGDLVEIDGRTGVIQIISSS